MRFVRPARFLLSGAVNTAVGLALIYFGMWLGLGDVTANLVGYAVGITISFLLNRNWTFEHRGHLAIAALRFALAVATAYLANLVTMLAARDWLGLDSWLAQTLAVGPYTVILYLLSSHFVFPRAPMRDMPPRKSAGTPVA